MMFRVGATLKAAMTSATAMSEMTKFRTSNDTFSRGKMIFSTLTFLMRGAASMMELMAHVVELDMRLKRMVPRMR